MDSRHEKLLEAFEEFEVDLEVEDILKKVKVELVLDPSVVEFGEKLKRRERGPCKSWNPLNVTWMTFRFLQDLLKDMSPDDWEQVMDDVEDSSFDLEALVPPDGIVDLLEDMSPDEGIDLMYDLVS